MASDKINIPSSGGGIVRYFDEYKSRFQVKPEYVLLAVGVVILLVVFLHKFRPLG
ncbi:preprotein translocase subunit Sec61beta [Candidatus Woesearchaeota archaeon]|nr:preprotein translocase subunit Sec61beta [Candidatus Woesearchaeota archaeon]